MSGLEGVKVGDKLIIHSHGRDSVEIVCRLTKTLVMTRRRGAGTSTESRYKKRDGWPTGGYMYNSRYARIPKDENEIAEIAEAHRIAAMLNRIDKYNFKRLTVSGIEAVIEIINTKEKAQ